MGIEFILSSVQFLGLGSINFPEWLGFGLSCLWIVGMANAINLIDGLDGLASGITLLGLLAVSVCWISCRNFLCYMDVDLTDWMSTRIFWFIIVGQLPSSLEIVAVLLSDT